jgi:hypothetical protein
MKLLTIALAMFLTACTLPGHQGGPMPRSTQYTYPGRAVHPETGVVRPDRVTIAEPTDGGVFGFGLVYWDGSTGTSVGQWDSLARCEEERKSYAALFADGAKAGGKLVLTVKCHRTQETGAGATQTR